MTDDLLGEHVDEPESNHGTRRIQWQGGPVTVSRADLFRHPELDATARLIALYKLEFPGDQTVPEIAAELNLGEARVRTAVAELAVEGMAKKYSEPGRGPGKPARRIWSFDVSTLQAFSPSILQDAKIESRNSETLKGRENGSTSGFDNGEAASVSRVSAPAPAPASVFSSSSTQEDEENLISENVDLGEGGAGGEPAKSPRRAAVAYSEEFEAVWLAYDRHGSKKPAYEQWKKAITRADPEVIVEALAAYIEATADDLHYRKHLERWLRDDRWESAVPVKPKLSAKERKSEIVRKQGSHDHWNTKMAAMTVEQAMKAYGVDEDTARVSIATAKAELAKKGAK